jgi:predicted amidophosphoribosyltransferase
MTAKNTCCLCQCDLETNVPLSLCDECGAARPDLPSDDSYFEEPPFSNEFDEYDKAMEDYVHKGHGV